MDFTILGQIWNVRTIATGSGIREIRRLRRTYGSARWRKQKGIARVELANGATRVVELHWSEAHGIGAHEHKIKRYLD